MKWLEGKRCKLLIRSEHKDLFFSVADVFSVTDTHISFIDKFGGKYSFLVKDVIEANVEVEDE